MKKLVSLFAVSLIFLIVFVSFSSAYYYGGYFDPYYGRGDYDAQYFVITRTQGGFYGPRMTTTTVNNRVTERYWDGRAWVDRTSYVRESRQTPYYYAPRYYPTYYSFYPDYRYQTYGSYYSYPRASYWY